MEKIKSASLMTAIKTPYKLDGDVDLESYDFLVLKHRLKMVCRALLSAEPPAKVI